MPKSSPVGWAVLSLFLGLGLGGSCSTCSRALPSSRLDEMAGTSGYRVGVVELTGEIKDTTKVVKQIRGFSKDEHVDALVIRIDSPGGAVAPSQEIYEALRSTAAAKPVVASMGNVAASGGFWAAVGADYIFASAGTVTGSIGVVSQTPDLRQLAEFLRLNMRTFRSGPIKDLGNPLRELTPEDEAVFMELVQDIYDQFVSVVAERRKLDTEAVLRLADGRVMTGRAALKAGLIDELGGFYEAARKAAYLAAEAKAREEGEELKEPEGDPTLVYPKREGPAFMELFANQLGDAMSRAMRQTAEDLAEAAQDSLNPTNVRVELR